MIARTMFAAVLVLSSSAIAHAHAMLERANPPVGGTVGSPPRAVSLTFTEKVEPAFSTIRVENASGARVDAGKPQVEQGNANTLRVGLKPLSPGTYKVIWKVLSVDTHTTQGSFSFQVGR
jgi:methionine-rich copper-binding protein CopC